MLPTMSIRNDFACVREMPEPKGRGVFAVRPIPAGCIIDEAAVVLHPKSDTDESLFFDYRFLWQGDTRALALGMLSLVNHSSTAPNSDVELDFERRTIRLLALREIADGEEITFDYGCNLWFDESH
jgi:SET domain-containing protein